jgi:hypothetical protein
MKALAKDPFKRYRSARELADDIRRYREFLPVSVIAPTKIEKLANWSRRRPRLATILATLAAVLVVGALAIAFEASVENARVATGYSFIDEVEAQLAGMEPEIEDLKAQRQDLGPGPERRLIENRLADLEAEFEMAEKDRMALALAITGFTILAPEQRARAIVRQSIFDAIEEHVAVGDFYRARAEIRFALRYYEGGNIFNFSEGDHALFQEKLATVEREIEIGERAARQAAEAAAAGNGE